MYDWSFPHSLCERYQSFESICIMQLQKEDFTFFHLSACWLVMRDLHEYMMQRNTCFHHLRVIEKNHVLWRKQCRQLMKMMIVKSCSVRNKETWMICRIRRFLRDEFIRKIILIVNKLIHCVIIWKSRCEKRKKSLWHHKDSKHITGYGYVSTSSSFIRRFSAISVAYALSTLFHMKWITIPYSTVKIISEAATRKPLWEGCMLMKMIPMIISIHTPDDSL